MNAYCAACLIKPHCAAGGQCRSRAGKVRRALAGEASSGELLVAEFTHPAVFFLVFFYTHAAATLVLSDCVLKL